MDTEFIANVIIKVMKDDPSKIIEAQDDAKFMIDAGASFGTSRESLMAEYAVVTFKDQNKDSGSFPELNDMTDDDENTVMNIVQAHIEKEGW